MFPNCSVCRTVVQKQRTERAETAAKREKAANERDTERQQRPGTGVGEEGHLRSRRFVTPNLPRCAGLPAGGMMEGGTMRGAAPLGSQHRSHGSNLCFQSQTGQKTSSPSVSCEADENAAGLRPIRLWALQHLNPLVGFNTWKEKHRSRPAAHGRPRPLTSRNDRNQTQRILHQLFRNKAMAFICTYTHTPTPPHHACTHTHVHVCHSTGRRMQWEMTQ